MENNENEKTEVIKIAKELNLEPFKSTGKIPSYKKVLVQAKQIREISYSIESESPQIAILKKNVTPEIAKNVDKHISKSIEYPLGSIVYAVAEDTHCNIILILDESNEPGQSVIYRRKEDDTYTFYIVFSPLKDKDIKTQRIIIYWLAYELAHIALAHDSSIKNLTAFGFEFKRDSLSESLEAHEWAIATLSEWEVSSIQRFYDFNNREVFKEILENTENQDIEYMKEIRVLFDRVLEATGESTISDMLPSQRLMSTIHKEYEENENRLYSLLSDFCLGTTTSDTKIHRYIQINIYFDLANIDIDGEITKIIGELCSAYGFAIVKNNVPVLGSFLKSLFAKTKDIVTENEVVERLKKIERSVELEAIEKKQADVDKNKAEAVKALLDSVKDIPNAVFQLGSLLVIKMTDKEFGVRVMTKSLNQTQMSLINQRPELLRQPHKILESFNLLS